MTPPSSNVIDPTSPDDSGELAIAFLRESRQLLAERLRFTILVATPIYLSFSVLDFFSLPELVWFLLAIRGGAVGVFAAVYFLTKTSFGRRQTDLLAWLMMYAGISGIALMTALSRGFESNYFIGMMLGVFVVGFFFPWRIRMTAGLSLAVLLTYVALNLLLPGPGRSVTPAMEALFFLGGACVLGVFATVSGQRYRQRELASRLQLRTVNQRLLALDEAKTRFFSNVSHELRTPLTLISGPLEQLLAEASDPEQRTRLATMQVNAQRLLRQVNIILDVTKLEAGRLQVKLAEGNLGKTIHGIVAAARPLADSRGLTLTEIGLADLPDSLYDLRKAEVIAANLITNAIKFTPSGGRIVVRGKQEGDHLVVEVQDTGRGIRERDQTRIFERFFQVETADAAKQEGTGLGLALTRELVELHGGQILVASEPGLGTTFTVRLPQEPLLESERRRGHRRREDRLAAARIDALVVERFDGDASTKELLADVATSPAPEQKAARASTSAAAARVLVVEDNVELRRFLADVLGDTYAVETAADGAEGLEAATRRPPDLIIADVMMPNIDGFEFCRRIKTDPSLAGVPTILVTARTSPDAVTAGLEAGADDYLGKPFAIEELLARVEAHLRTRRAERRLDERESRLVAVGGMVATLVHDLRNPLTVITAVADLIMHRTHREPHEEALVEDVANIASQAARLQRMLADVIELARGGVPSLNVKPVEVATWIAKIGGELDAQILGEGIAFEIDTSGLGGVTVSLDRDAFHRVLENLLVNARRALRSTPTLIPEPRIRLTGWVEEEEAVFRLADNGPGIAPQMRNTLFEPFATGDRQSGIGIGLATARNVVLALGGDISLEESPAEGGAAFLIRLPLATGAG